MSAGTRRFVRFANEGHACCLTLFLLVGIAGSSTQGVSSTSMGWGTFSACSGSLFSALARLLAFFLGLGWLAVACTSTGTSRIPRECALGFHSITFAVVFVSKRLAASTMSCLHGMEYGMGYVFL